MKKRKERLSLGPVFTIMIMILIIMITSFIFSILQIRGDRTSIVNGTLETSVVSVQNIFSLSGFKYLLSNTITNLHLFEPLYFLIVSLIGIGIGEKSGLFKAVFSNSRTLKIGPLTVITLFLSIISTVIGEYSFALILPFVGVLYKYMGKNPVYGILVSFIGLTIGYASGVFINYDTYSLGILTEAAAKVEVDPNYIFSSFSTYYIFLSSAFILTIIGSVVVLKFLEPKLPSTETEIEEDLKVDKSALMYSNFTLILLVIIIIYMIIPGLPFSGMLLDRSEKEYIPMLLGENSPFRNSIIFIVSDLFMICGYIYGRMSGNIKNSTDYSVGLSKSFDNLGYVFVLMFFASQMIGLLNYTNLGEVVATILINWLSSVNFSGIILILTFFIIVILISILVPGTLEKYSIVSPMIVPLFMRANITPDFTQFIFQVADGIGKSITPIFMYFIVLIAFLEKYDTNEKTKTTIFGTIRVLLPSILILTGVWILIILGFYIIGLPIGVGTQTTL